MTGRRRDDDLRALYRDNLTDLVRRVIVVSLGVGVPTIVVLWFLLAPRDPVVRWGYPPLLVHLLVYGWVLLRRPAQVLTFSRVTLLLLEALWTASMVVRLRGAPDVHTGWDSLFPTVFMSMVIYVVIGYLFLSPRRALANAGAVVVGVLAAGLVGLLPLEGGREYVLPLVRYCIGVVVLSLLLHVLSRAKARLALAVADAHRAAAEVVEMRDMAYMDALTGLANRRRLVEELSFQSSRTVPGHPVAVVFFDLDRFKAINDEHGHAIGDEVLCRVADLAVRLVRKGDVVGRLGGEEFVIVAPGTDYEHALQLAERVRSVLPLDVGEAMGFPVTASFGVSMLQLGESASDVLRRVDGLMYQAKAAGRDHVSGALV